MKKYRIGIDIGATNTKLGLFDDEMKLIDQMQKLTDPEADLDRLLDIAEKLVRHIVSSNGICMEDLLGVGLAIPSSIDYRRGMVMDCDYIMAFSHTPLQELLKERLGVPVQLENDANAAAIAEHRLGAGKGQDHMIYAALATGIGGGIIINNQIYHGMHGMAGEIGHMLVSDSTGYPCPCGASGCVQSIASGAYMAKYVTDRIKEGEDSAILNYSGTLASVDMVAVGKALRVNDALALEVVGRGAEYIGRMFHSLNQIFDINYFVYGGGMVKLGNRFIDRIIAAYRHYSLMDHHFPAQFVPAQFGDQGGMYGAALLVSDPAKAEA